MCARGPARISGRAHSLPFKSPSWGEHCPAPPLLSPHLPYTCAVGRCSNTTGAAMVRCLLMGPIYSWIPVGCCAVFQAANHCRLRFCVLVRRLDRASFNCDAHACRLLYAPHGACLRLGVSHVDQTACISRVGSLNRSVRFWGAPGGHQRRCPVATRPRFSRVTDFG